MIPSDEFELNFWQQTEWHVKEIEYLMKQLHGHSLISTVPFLRIWITGVFSLDVDLWPPEVDEEEDDENWLFFSPSDWYSGPCLTTSDILV